MKRSPRLVRGRRLTYAVVVALGGPVFTILADLLIVHRYPTYAEGHWLAGPVWDVLFAAPFMLLALLILTTGMSTAAAAVAAVGLATVIGFAFWAFATSDSSTAAVGLLLPWFYGFPLVLLAFAVDAAVRAAVTRRSQRQAREM